MEDLYALPPEDFTSARDAEVTRLRADGDKDAAKELAAQRKPSVSAWVVNLLTRAEADLVEQLLDLGRALAEAQAARSGSDLRELGAQRRQLVDAVARRAAELVDRTLTAAVRDEVVSTLEAALADPAAADAVRSGRLVRALSYAGFGEVDVDGAVARPLRLVPPPADDRDDGTDDGDGEDDGRIAAAEREALEAQGALDDAAVAHRRAVRAAADAESALQHAAEREEAARRKATQARKAADEAARAAEQAEAEAARLREEQDAATAARDEAVSGAESAAAAVEEAQRAAETARAALDRLRRSPGAGAAGKPKKPRKG